MPIRQSANSAGESFQMNSACSTVAQLKAFHSQTRGDPDAIAYMWGMASELDDTTMAARAGLLHRANADACHGREFSPDCDWQRHLRARHHLPRRAGLQLLSRTRLAWVAGLPTARGSARAVYPEAAGLLPEQHAQRRHHARRRPESASGRHASSGCVPGSATIEQRPQRHGISEAAFVGASSQRPLLFAPGSMHPSHPITAQPQQRKRERFQWLKFGDAFAYD